MRRMQWQYPEGVKVVAEYWLQTDDPSVISVVEVDDVGMLAAMRAAWDDLFEIEAFPAMTHEDGLAMLEQMAAS